MLVARLEKAKGIKDSDVRQTTYVYPDNKG